MNRWEGTKILCIETENMKNKTAAYSHKIRHKAAMAFHTKVFKLDDQLQMTNDNGLTEELIGSLTVLGL